jgi:hypothetical protein
MSQPLTQSLQAWLKNLLSFQGTKFEQNFVRTQTAGLPLLVELLWPGNTNWRGSLSTIDLLIKVACFVNK